MTVVKDGEIMIFYDIEVFKCDWLVVLYDGENVTRIHNNVECLTDYYNKHKNDVWVGYNNKGYDQYILQCILCGLNPKRLNDWIIKEHKAPWRFSDLLKQYPVNTFDCMVFGKSLKQLESYLGVNIHETAVDFDIDRPLTEDELELEFQYCEFDVENTVRIFLLNKDEFNASMGLVKYANLPISNLSKTKAQLTAHIMQAKPLDNKLYDEEFDFEYVQAVKDYDYKNKDVIEFFDSIRNTKDNTASYDTNLYGIPTTFALGGIHGAIPNYIYKPNDNEILYHVDIASYYPHLMKNWGLISRAIPSVKHLSDIMEERLRLKHEKNPLQKVLKICINSLYGVSGGGKRLDNGEYKVLSKVYDPRRMREVCINGQLLILQLVEDLSAYGSLFNCVQLNTDGVIYKVQKVDVDLFKSIISEWEKRAKMTMEYDNISFIAQRDVNNYIAVFDGCVWERKGSVFKKSSALDYDLPIVQDAVCEYFINGVHPKDYIEQEEMLMPFMKTYKVSSSYLYATHNGVKQQGKVFRVFASKRRGDTPLFKAKDKGEKGIVEEKFANCPNCYIDNSDIREKTVPRYLDKNWYINYAIKQINSVYGYEKLSGV